MCGISGCLNLKNLPIDNLKTRNFVMNNLISHRGPDGEGYWQNPSASVGLGHARLAIIDQTSTGSQPMVGLNQEVIVFNGEIYNYKDLKKSESHKGRIFNSQSDTECILALYERYGIDFVTHLRGMFALAIWDESKRELILARDRFGIKPLYYTIQDEILYFASEVKALLPFVKKIGTNTAALGEYFTFQSILGNQTLFNEIKQVMPGEIILVRDGVLKKKIYWDISYQVDFSHSEEYYLEKLKSLLNESIDLHLVSDVEIGTYLSGGLDSSLIASLAQSKSNYSLKTFHGRYADYEGYDESEFAKALSEFSSLDLVIEDFNSSNLTAILNKVIYHLDYPIAGPGAIPQFLISQIAAQKVKVVLGGQGGDEIFGGYARYLIGYLEQCLRASIDGTSNNGNFVVTLESIIPNLGLLREYKPLLRNFWKEGLFGNLDERYFRLIDKSSDTATQINWDFFEKDKIFESYLSIFNSVRNVSKEAYFDSMTHFDFKTLLPALLQVEDRMSMAHGLESRVPFLDHPLVEFVASIPADIKFKNGELKRILKRTFADKLPSKITTRRDKMGFPVPLMEWMKEPVGHDLLGLIESLRDRDLEFLNSKNLTNMLAGQPRFSRGLWAMLSIEVWFQQFHDSTNKFKEAFTSCRN
jgi:asparagine synthase (glutamine-hydrolysing)